MSITHPEPNNVAGYKNSNGLKEISNDMDASSSDIYIVSQCFPLLGLFPVITTSTTLITTVTLFFLLLGVTQSPMTVAMSTLMQYTQHANKQKKRHKFQICDFILQNFAGV